MIPLPKKPKLSKKEENITVVEVEGLYPGYGVTLGNSLRRVLLSSLEGAAITEVMIKNAPHEFSTIPGVLEDTVLILLNLKKMRFKMFGDESQTVILKVSGEKIVTAADFELPSQVEVVNKDLHLATLTDKKANLEIEATVRKGVGYETVEKRKEEKSEIGLISLDALYNPVKRVAFHVEDMRVGERTDFDRLTLEIETDGTLDPEDAFSQACRILESHVGVLLEEKGTAKKKKVKKEEAQKETKTAKTTEESSEEDNAKIKIDDLGLSTRTTNALSENSIKSVGGLIRKSESDLLEMKGLGEAGIDEIKKSLKKIDLELKQD